MDLILHLFRPLLVAARVLLLPTFLPEIPETHPNTNLVPNAQILARRPRMSLSTSDESTDAQPENMSLNTLPYDLLLNVAQHLDLRDIQALQLVSPGRVMPEPRRRGIDNANPRPAGPCTTLLVPGPCSETSPSHSCADVVPSLTPVSNASQILRRSSLWQLLQKRRASRRRGSLEHRGQRGIGPSFMTPARRATMKTRCQTRRAVAGTK